MGLLSNNMMLPGSNLLPGADGEIDVEPAPAFKAPTTVDVTTWLYSVDVSGPNYTVEIN